MKTRERKRLLTGNNWKSRWRVSRSWCSIRKMG